MFLMQLVYGKCKHIYNLFQLIIILWRKLVLDIIFVKLDAKTCIRHQYVLNSTVKIGALYPFFNYDIILN